MALHHPVGRGRPGGRLHGHDEAAGACHSRPTPSRSASKPAAPAGGGAKRPPPPDDKPGDETFEAEFADLYATEQDPTLLDVGELSALLRLLTRHLGTAIGVGDLPSLTKLFDFRRTLSLTLNQIRPPEKVDPLRDPTNLEALAELRARYLAMREPLEVSPPLVAAYRAHVEELERRAAAAATTDDEST